MVGGKRMRWYGAVVAVCVIVAGCVGLGDSAPSGGMARRRPAADKPAAELRIPADAVAQAPDIPLVPVPSPPLGRQTSNQPEARPASVPRASSPAPPVIATTPTTPMQTPPAASAPPSATPSHTARQLLQQAAARCATLDSYIVRLTRREYLKDKNQPEEIMLFKFRKEPWSVHFKWLGDTARGREVVYVKGRYENKIHTKLAAGDAPLMAAGSRISVAPDSLLARSASRHPITDAGICHCVESLLAQLDAQERGDRRQGTLAAIAPQRRPEYPRPVETLERLLPPGVEPQLPRGGRRLIFFDPDWRLPMLVVTYDEKGHEVEYYRYDRMQAPVHLDDDDFNPDKLWADPVKTPPSAPGR